MFSATKGGSPSGYQISRSVRLRSSASAYFARTMASGGVTVYTFSAWVKRGTLGVINPIVQGYLNNNNYGHIIFKADNTIEWREVSVAANYGQVSTNAVFRDPSAWYHIVVVRNGSSLTIYVNGVSQTLTVSTAVNAAAGYLFGGSTAQRIGSDQVNSAFFDGYLTECYLIDGQALTPSSFGQTNGTTGVWSPIKYTGTYGTNGFYLNFSDNSGATATTIGKDFSGNGNNWTPNNISVTAGVTYDSMLDVPTQWADGGNGRGNYAVINPLNNSGGVTISDGNLKALWASASDRSVLSTFPIPSTGKFYAEFVNGTLTSASVAVAFGLATEGSSRTGMIAANMWVYYASNQSYISRNGTLSSQIGTNQTIAAGGILQVAIDRDNNQAWLGYNNVWVNATNGTTGDPSAGTNPTVSSLPADLFVMVGLYAENGNVNFGQRPFTYTPPTGFKALNTLNLPQPTILKGNQYMNVVTYTATPGTGNTISGVGFQTDLLWTKNRDNAEQHYWQDSVRGFSPSAGVTQMLSSNSSAAETSVAGITCTTTSDGFTVVDSAPASGEFWFTNRTYVAWCWKEGATQGFDIVTYTEAAGANTIPHNLGVTPKMFITKRRDGAENWVVWFTGFAANEGIYLNSTAAKGASGSSWISLNSSNVVVTSGQFTGTGSKVAYLFSEVAGFSKFGSYTGNGSTDGTFVFCGFRPRYVLLKSSTQATDWYIYDTARDTYNLTTLELNPNLSAAEQNGTYGSMDILSNGFKLRFAGGEVNVSSQTYIYMAFAENPFKNALAR